MFVQSLMFAVSGVSVEWVNDSFTSLRVSLPGGSTYRITYTSVNERNITEPKTVTTNSISHVVKDFRSDWFYTVLVEVVSLNSGEAMNWSIGIGEHNHVMLLHARRVSCKFYLCNCTFFIWRAGIGIAVAVAIGIIFVLLGQDLATVFFER